MTDQLFSREEDLIQIAKLTKQVEKLRQDNAALRREKKALHQHCAQVEYELKQAK